MADVCIVGGGIMGLLTAFNLANSGVPVCLIEQHGLGQEASWAGGGLFRRFIPGVTALR